MIYIIIAIYILILSYYYDFHKNKKESLKQIHYYLLLLILIMLSGIRYRMAPDTVAYMSNFDYYTQPLFNLKLSDFTSSRYQPFWIILNSSFKIFDNYLLFQITVSAITNSSIFYFFKRSSSSGQFSYILVYYLTCYFYFNMEILRESLAISMFLISIIKYNNQKYSQALLFIFFAFMFHQYALFLFTIYFALSRKISLQTKVITLTLLLTSIVYIDDPFVYFNFISVGHSELDLTFYDVDREMTAQGIIYHILRIMPILFFIIAYQKKQIPNMHLNKKIIITLCIIWISIIVIRILKIPFFDRLGNYFIIFVIFFVTATLIDFLNKNFRQSLRFIIFSSVNIVALIFYILPLTKPDQIYGIPTYKRYYPYYSVFSKKTDPDREFITAIEAKE